MKREFKVLFSNTIMMYLMQLSGYIFPLFTFPYLTRILNPSSYGIIVFVSAIMMYFQLLIDFGFLLSATKECGENRNDNNKLSEILSSVIGAKIILSVIGSIVIFILIITIPSFNDKRLFILLSYLSVVTSILMPDYLFRGLEKMNIITYMSIIGKIIYTISIFLLIKTDSDYILIPVINLISNVIIFFLIYIEIRKMNIHIAFYGMRKIIDQLKKSFVFFISRIASTAYSASNVFILGFMISNASLAQYGVSNTLITTIKSMFSPIADSIYPYMLHKKNYKLVYMILIITTPLIILGTIGLFILAKPIIMLLAGKQYIEVVPIFRLMLPLIVITLPSYLLGFPVLGAMNKMKEANLTVIIAAIFHLLGLILLLSLNIFTVSNVIKLTIASESLVLIMRLYYVLRVRKNERGICI